MSNTFFFILKRQIQFLWKKKLTKYVKIFNKFVGMQKMPKYFEKFGSCAVVIFVPLSWVRIQSAGPANTCELAR